MRDEERRQLVPGREGDRGWQADTDLATHFAKTVTALHPPPPLTENYTRLLLLILFLVNVGLEIINMVQCLQ